MATLAKAAAPSAMKAPLKATPRGETTAKPAAATSARTAAVLKAALALFWIAPQTTRIRAETASSASGAAS